jgi:hypothetical protein
MTEEVPVSAIRDFSRGEGPLVETGYRVGDSWVQTVGPHAEHAGKIYVIGPGLGLDKQGRMGSGILVRCGGCLFSWVIR